MLKKLFIPILCVIYLTACSVSKEHPKDYSSLESSLEILFDSVDGEGAFRLDTVEMSSLVVQELSVSNAEHVFSEYLVETFTGGEWESKELSEADVKELLGEDWKDVSEVKIGGKAGIWELTYSKGEVFFMVIYSEEVVTKSIRYEGDSISIHPDGGFQIYKE